MTNSTDNLRIQEIRPLLPPAILIEEIPLDETGAATITAARQKASDIIQGRDDRLLVIVGPCSIHDKAAALDYAQRLLPITTKLAKELCIIMRVYFEKPRTTIGWKGLINDPSLDGRFQINQGLRTARKLLTELAAMGMPAGTEFLDSIIPQFISDTIAWGAIGARTTESQVHRELASGLSMPVGFKNGTDGNIQIAVDAILAAHHAHHFLSVTKQGLAAIVTTYGNDDCHLILRGSNKSPNYDFESIAAAESILKAKGCMQRIMVDCSHGNSSKDFTKQKLVANSLCEQLRQGSTILGGVMIESHLVAGNQALKAGKPLVYGQSITDACIGFEETVEILHHFAQAIQARRQAT